MGRTHTWHIRVELDDLDKYFVVVNKRIRPLRVLGPDECEWIIKEYLPNETNREQIIEGGIKVWDEDAIWFLVNAISKLKVYKSEEEARKALSKAA